MKLSSEETGALLLAAVLLVVSIAMVLSSPPSHDGGPSLKNDEERYIPAREVKGIPNKRECGTPYWTKFYPKTYPVVDAEGNIQQKFEYWLFTSRRSHAGLDCFGRRNISGVEYEFYAIFEWEMICYDRERPIGISGDIDNMTCSWRSGPKEKNKSKFFGWILVRDYYGL